MEKFQLSLWLKIIGIGSASGLVYHDDKLFIISDSSNYLYEYTIQDAKLNRIALTENPQQNIAKKDKPDFEAIAINGEKLVILGSGSTANRNCAYVYNDKSEKTKEKDLTELYNRIKTQLNFKHDELNIEGLIINQKDLYFFQRGNGTEAKNGIIYAYDDLKDPKLKFTEFDLPKINTVVTTFTDAILIDETIYFLAAAEDTASTYQDGEILGSIMGTIDLKTMELKSAVQISSQHKFEGLTLYKKNADQIEFLLCEDPDSGIAESGIYKLTLAISQ